MTEPVEAAIIDWNRTETSLGRSHYTAQSLELADASRPITRQALRAIGVDGIEFGSHRTEHASRMAADLMRISAGGTQTEPGHVYRMNGDRYYVELDIRGPLPFEDDCVEWVYAEHLIEHVSLPDGIHWLAEVRRILAAGGLVRLSTPDVAKYASGYVEDGEFLAEHRKRMDAAVTARRPMPQRRAFMLNQIFYHFGHRWIYDEEELRHALVEAGFRDELIYTRRCGYGMRADVAALDRSGRNDESLYVEAIVAG